MRTQRRETRKILTNSHAAGYVEDLNCILTLKLFAVAKLHLMSPESGRLIKSKLLYVIHHVSCTLPTSKNIGIVIRLQMTCS